MNFIRKNIALLLVVAAWLIHFQAFCQADDSLFLSFVTTPASVEMFWKDGQGNILRSLKNLNAFVHSKNKTLRFAMNGGMYLKDNSPQGLFIYEGTMTTPLDTSSGFGNFYLKPNGVFYIAMGNEAMICKTENFPEDAHTIKWATQSGPMLLIDGKIHPAFIKGSSNLNIRNGVGILPDGRVIFAMSKHKVNFYDFATFFKNQHCDNALYLDGFVSRTYLPEKNWKQMDGNFGVMIGVTEDIGH